MKRITDISCRTLVGWMQLDVVTRRDYAFDIIAIMPLIFQTYLATTIPVNLKNNPTSPMNSVFNNIRYHLSFGLLTLRHWDYPRNLRLINAPTPVNLLNNPYETDT